MDWVRRIGELLAPPSGVEPDEPAPGPVERASPGVAALFEAASEGGGHVVLDLGSSAGTSLEIYRRFARQIRFADVLSVRAERGLDAALGALPERPERPFDLVFAWNTLDWMFPRERPRLVRRLAEISAPGARLHVVVDLSDEESGPSYRYSLLDVDRMRGEPAESGPRSRRPLLPADVEDLLDPFEVVRGFTLKEGLREYVAER